MNLKIETLTIERFRVFRHITLERLGRVNLITGRNNSGKSSVLEALRLLASDAAPAVINGILQSREEGDREAEDALRASEPDGDFALSSLFHGFPRLSANLDPIVIMRESDGLRMQLRLEVGWFSQVREPDGSRRLVPSQPAFFGASDGVPALVVDSDAGRRIVPLGQLSRSAYRPRTTLGELPGSAQLPCVFVSPYGGERTATLGPLWDQIALSDSESAVVEALQIIDPKIQAVSMVGGEGARQPRTAIVRSAGMARPVPLRSYGDGLNRLFGMILSLVNAEDGLLLIDEFENGLHYSVQVDIWRAIFALARRLNVQVVATSHSWDTIEAFQKVAGQDPEEGALIRLVRREDRVIPTRFSERELAIATRDGIEVR